MSRYRSSHRPYILKHNRGRCSQLESALKVRTPVCFYSPSHMQIPIAQPQTLRDLGGREVVCICPLPILGVHHLAGAEPGFSAVVIDMWHSSRGLFCACSVAPLPCTPEASSISHPKMRPPDICSANQLPLRNRSL